MNLSKVKSLVSSAWLKQAISSHPKFCLLEASWAPRGKGHESFLQKHIPSASFFDMWEGVTPTQKKPRDLPDPRLFEEYSQELGINEDSHIVIYDKSVAFFSSRLWYTFKLFGHENVSVLNGGFPYWQHQNFPTESGDTKYVEPGNYKVKDVNKALLKSYEEMIANALQNKFQIVDVRSSTSYQGIKEPSKSTVVAVTSAGFPEPKDMVNGHIPHSFNIDNDDFIDPETNCVVSKEKILQMFSASGVDPNKPLTSMCYNGVSACLVPLAVSQLDQETDVSVYTGSWTEFGQRASSKDTEVSTHGSNQPASGG